MNETTPVSTAPSVNSYLIPGAVILAGLLIAGSVIWNNSHPATIAPVGTEGEQAMTADISRIKLEGEPYIGNANAPIVIAYWSDYQCPFCKKFEEETLPTIMTNYVQTGKAKVVFKDFAFLGQDSIVAGEYARSVWALYPSLYFDWRTAMFAAQDDEGDRGFGDAASIQTLTKGVKGIDTAKVTADVAANKAKYDAAMSADRTEAQSQGVSATPSFIIGKGVIAGAQPYAQFEAALNAVK